MALSRPAKQSVRENADSSANLDASWLLRAGHLESADGVALRGDLT